MLVQHLTQIVAWIVACVTSGLFEATGTVVVRLKPMSGMLCLTVSDNGTGMILDAHNGALKRFTFVMAQPASAVEGQADVRTNVHEARG